MMNKEKSFDELLNSILNLIKEAKCEYQSFLKKDFTNADHLNDKISSQKDSYFEKKTDNDQSENKSKGLKESKVLSNWKNIDFKKNIKDSNLYDNSNANLNIEQIFNALMDEWISNNLRRIVELEFSKYIKKSNN